MEGFLSDQPDLKSCIGDSDLAMVDVVEGFQDILKRDLPDMADGLRKIADALDALPGAMKACNASESDIKDIVNVLKSIKGLKDLATHVVDDLRVNFKDILSEFEVAVNGYQHEQYESCGKQLGMALRRIVVGTSSLQI